MSVLVTTAILLGLLAWAVGSYGRLLRLRAEVTRRWREVHALRKQAAAPPSPSAPADGQAAEARRALAHAERIYNLAAARYNAAIEKAPGNLLAGLAGFRRAELIDAPRPADQ